jgi:hypothetical protein
VTIPDAETQRFIYNTFTQVLHYRDVVWIGMTDQQRENHHVWVDGELKIMYDGDGCSVSLKFASRSTNSKTFK